MKRYYYAVKKNVKNNECCSSDDGFGPHVPLRRHREALRENFKPRRTVVTVTTRKQRSEDSKKSLDLCQSTHDSESTGAAKGGPYVKQLGQSNLAAQRKEGIRRLHINQKTAVRGMSDDNSYQDGSERGSNDESGDEESDDDDNSFDYGFMGGETLR